MQVEWDIRKWRENLKKHGVDFQDAALIFDNPVLEAVDARQDYQEIRWRAVGHVDDEYFLVVYTWRGVNRRIISAWRLDDEGRQRYTDILAGRTPVKTPSGKTKTRSNAPSMSVGEDFWKRARLTLPDSRSKVHTGLRLDADMLEWFKADGKGWQTRMNAILRHYYEHHR
ncbi:MAG: BrnT family toxin [Caldilineaceae bacterium]